MHTSNSKYQTIYRYWISDVLRDYRARHPLLRAVEPLPPEMHTNPPEPFEPDVWRRHEKGDVYRG